MPKWARICQFLAAPRILVTLLASVLRRGRPLAATLRASVIERQFPIAHITLVVDHQVGSNKGAPALLPTFRPSRLGPAPGYPLPLAAALPLVGVVVVESQLLLSPEAGREPQLPHP